MNSRQKFTSGWKGALCALLTAGLLHAAQAAPAKKDSTEKPLNPSNAEVVGNAGFLERLVPIGGQSSSADNAAALKALRAWKANPSDYRILENFVRSHPNSPWVVGISTNLGLIQFREGYLNRALACYERAWERGKSDQTPEGRALTDRALGEFAALLARLGRFDRLEELLAEVESRPLIGAATELVEGARQGLAMMRYSPDVAFRCGPLALDRILRTQGEQFAGHPEIRAMKSTHQGTSLAEIAALAGRVGLRMQAAYREPGAEILSPSVMHWSAGHFASVIRKQGDRYRIEDATFKQHLWVSDRALNEEASGYFLVAEGPLPKGWRTVGEPEAKTVWGKGQVNSSDPFATKTTDIKARAGQNPCGMAVYNFHALLASLTIEDQPLTSTSPVGPVVNLRVTYNQREATQTTNAPWSNFGPKTSFNWHSMAVVNGRNSFTNLPSEAYVNLPGGGVEFYSGEWPEASAKPYIPPPPYNPTYAGTIITYYSPPHPESQARLAAQAYQGFIGPLPVGEQRPPPPALDGNIARYLADGSKYEYTLAPEIVSSEVFFLATLTDPQGNSASLEYTPPDTTTGAPRRLSRITDAVGGVTEFYYDDSTYPDRIKWVTNYKATATFNYDANGRLASITDGIGLTSEFKYDAGDFIQALKTPYGTTRFAYQNLSLYGSGIYGPGVTNFARSITATDPEGNTEYLEYRDVFLGKRPPGVPSDETPVPAGIAIRNESSPAGQTLAVRNSFYWDKKAYREAAKNYSKAKVFHWLHGADFVSSVGYLESEKNPLERRVWYNYQGQQDMVNRPGSAPTLFNGTNLISKAARVVDKTLDDGTVTTETQLEQWEYNNLGHVTKATDPAGRVLSFSYHPNRIDLYEVRNITGGQNVLLLRLENYYLRRPQTITDAGGFVTNVTYNARGQVSKVTNPKSEVTDYIYNPSGFLENIQVQGSIVQSFTPDAYSRIASVTDGAGYRVEFLYDALDRVTKKSYPDGTYETFWHDRLDPEWTRDRAGRWTQTIYDYARRPSRIIDPLQRTTILNWCGCGELESIIDGEGRVTEFEYDIMGRLTKKRFPNNQELNFAYEAGSSRLKQRVDAHGQITKYRYYSDDRLQGVKYVNAITATPDLGFVYDPVFGRIQSRTDAIGTTVYDYYPYPASGTQTGAGEVSSLTVPRGGGVSDPIGFGYDQLGRVASIVAGGASQTIQYDALGRANVETNPLGTFTTEFVQNSGLKDQVKRGGAVFVDYTWQTNAEGGRLARITNLVATADCTSCHISQFDYTYDAVGNVTSWETRRDGVLADILSLVYDPADQLIRSIRAGPGGGVLSETSYLYDRGGHRTQEQRGLELGRVDDKTNVNQWVRSGGGQLRIWGQIDEEGTVKVDGQTVPVDQQKRFEGFLSVASAGPRNFTVQAWDLNNNPSPIKNYMVNVTVPSSATYSLDNNGNVASVSNGGPSYTWDAEDRLVKIVQGNTESNFAYDGLDRLVQVVEKQNGSVVRDQRWLWVGLDRAVEFAGTAATPVKRFYSQGVEIVGGPSPIYLYTRDHLGSIREVYDGVNGTIVARYDYDAYGRQSVIGTETVASDFGFTGHWRHAPNGQAPLWLAPYRIYDSEIGRWLSRDPVGESGGLHLHGYAANNPTTFTDPLGLCAENGVLGAASGNSSQIAKNLQGKGGTGGGGGGRRGGGRVASGGSGGDEPPEGPFGSSNAPKRLPATLNPKQINFMQSSIKNQTGEFTVLGNAEALKAGTLKLTDLTAIRVWADNAGKIWTLDHRRLAAFRLGEVGEVPVQWVSPAVVRQEMWKMTTKSGGTSIRLKLGDGRSMIIE